MPLFSVPEMEGLRGADPQAWESDTRLQDGRESSDGAAPPYLLTQMKLQFESMFSGGRRFHSAPRDRPK